MKMTRTPSRGEELFLEKQGDKIFFRSVEHPEDNLVLNTNWAFEFNEDLSYRRDGKIRTAAGKAAVLIEHEGDALFEYPSNVRISVIDIEPTATLRLKFVRVEAHKFN